MVELLGARKITSERLSLHALGHLDLPRKLVTPSRISPSRRIDGVAARMSDAEVLTLFGIRP